MEKLKIDYSRLINLKYYVFHACIGPIFNYWNEMEFCGMPVETATGISGDSFIWLYCCTGQQLKIPPAQVQRATSWTCNVVIVCRIKTTLRSLAYK
jgi:hypothetical protein